MKLGWLKAVGKGIASGAKALVGMEDNAIVKALLQRVNPRVSETLDTAAEIAGDIVKVEAIGASLNLDGPAKLQAATPLVIDALKRSHLLKGTVIHDEDRFAAGAAKIAEGFVDVLSSIDESKGAND